MRLIDADALLKALNDYGLSYRADINGMIMQAQTIAPSGDLISRADAIEAICEDCYEDCSKGIHQMGCQTIETLKALPSADRPKGEWIKKQVFNPELDKYVPLIECSVCGYEPYYGGSESKFNYCANCGADMRGDEK